jgi:hypothetical protein
MKRERRDPIGSGDGISSGRSELDDKKREVSGKPTNDTIVPRRGYPQPLPLPFPSTFPSEPSEPDEISAIATAFVRVAAEDPVDVFGGLRERRRIGGGRDGVVAKGETGVEGMTVWDGYSEK